LQIMLNTDTESILLDTGQKHAMPKMINSKVRMNRMNLFLCLCPVFFCVP
jgi:hypothetical protein